jgi:hypothetical protein
MLWEVAIEDEEHVVSRPDFQFQSKKTSWWLLSLGFVAEASSDRKPREKSRPRKRTVDLGGELG